MATVKRRSTVPYYAAAGTWVIYALLFPLYRVPHFLFVAVVSGVVFFIMNAVCGTVEVTVPDPPKKEETTGNPELDKMIRDGNLAISEMKRLNDSIKDAKISAVALPSGAVRKGTILQTPCINCWCMFSSFSLR